MSTNIICNSTKKKPKNDKDEVRHHIHERKRTTDWEY